MRVICVSHLRIDAAEICQRGGAPDRIIDGVDGQDLLQHGQFLREIAAFSAYAPRLSVGVQCVGEIAFFLIKFSDDE